MLSVKLEKQMMKIKKATNNVTNFKAFFSLNKEVQDYILNQQDQSSKKFNISEWKNIMKLESISQKPIVQWLSYYNCDTNLVLWLINISENISLKNEHLEELFKSASNINELYKRYDNSSFGKSIEERVLYFLLSCYKHNVEFSEELLDRFIEGTLPSYDRDNIWTFVFEVITRGYQISLYSFLNPRQNHYYHNYPTVLYYNKVFQLDKRKMLSQSEHSRLSNILGEMGLSKETEQKLESLIEKTSIKQIYEILSQYYRLNLTPSLSELKKMEMKLAHNQLNSDANIFETLYGPKISVLFTSDLLSESSKIFVEFLIKNKKKKFLDTVIEIATEQYSKLDKFVHVGLYEEMGQLVNLNTLSKSDIMSLSDSPYNIFDKARGIVSYFKDCNVLLTLNEFKELITKHSLFHFEFYQEAISRNIKIDDRLKLLRQLPAFNFNYTKDCKGVTVNSHTFKFKPGFIQSLVDQFSQKGFKQRKKEISILTNDDVVSLFTIIYYDECKPFISEIKTLDDIKVILDFDLEEGISLQQIKKISYESDEEFQEFKNITNFSDEFIKDNLDSYIAFHEKGLTKVFNKLYRNSESRQKKNLVLITKAEIAGKLTDIKFVDEDFTKEIGLEITDKAKEIWKKDLSLSDDALKVHETSDFEKTIRLGQYPVETCQHWKGGSYSDALLSNFDTNKKLLTAFYKGAYVARAVVRLTKISDRKPEKKRPKEDFGFIDVETANNADVDETNNSDSINERLAIFLEYTYTSLDSQNAKKAKELFAKLLKEKADQMGAVLVLSNHYDVSIPTNEDTVYVYISKSKNGKQYLDSVGGYAQGHDEETYTSSTVKIVTK
ncbi:hypothetical protein AAGG74_17935 [Bacillus mexicanus]|uniref:hypothetical protein n=1 Tax=Bacillus mexicanus TaxID=2834415 RepID=UPI003D1AB7EF